MQHQLLMGLAASQVALLGVFLTSAEAASEHSDECLEEELLKKAFVTYCEAAIHVEQLKEDERGTLAEDLSRLSRKLKSAYAGEI